MPELLSTGGVVVLWAGWSVTLPVCYCQRNVDGSWSAWGGDWTMDVTIIEATGTASNELAIAENLPAVRQRIRISGSGWIGTKTEISEIDGEQTVFRLAATLTAPNTIMSCYVSYLAEAQGDFAEGLLRGVRHRVAASLH